MLRKITSLLLLVTLASFAQAVGWVGNTKLWLGGQSFPYRAGYIEPFQQLTVTTETWPIETGQQVVAVVTRDHWQTTQEYVFTYDYNVGNNSKWYCVLPLFGQGSQVDFYVRATRVGQSNAFYDSNGSANFGYLQRLAPNGRRGSILQWFATDYNTILRRLPEVVQAGYSAIYVPCPAKSGGGGFSVGYNPVDRFDLGDRYQEGTVRTQYGTTQELLNLIKVAHRFGIEVYCDMVLNHNDNRASHAINRYPDMIPEDFHIHSSADATNSEVNFNTESAFSFGMLNHDLVGLADIAQEDGNNVRTGTFSLPSYVTNNPWDKPSFVRQPTTPQLYPNQTPVAEDVREYMERWCKWLTGTVGFDGFRLDAVKHMPPGYLGWAPDQAASQGFTHGNLLTNLYGFNPNLYIFGEDYTSGSYELKEYAKTGMNLLDFPMVFNLRNIFNSHGLGDLGASLSNGWGVDTSTGLGYQMGGLSPDVDVAFVQSHDDGPPESNNLAYAFLLGRPGRAKVYYDGNNILPDAWSNFPRPGRADALGFGNDMMTRLVDANERFGRGSAVNRAVQSNLYIFERQVNGRGVALIGLNNRGDHTALSATFNTGFSPGVVLEDLTGQRPNVTVGAGGSVSITVPSNDSASQSNNGTGFVFYAPKTPQAVAGKDPVVIWTNESGRTMTPAKTALISTPGGNYASGRSFRAAQLRATAGQLRVSTDSLGDQAFVKLDDGVALPGWSLISGSPEGLTDGFQPLTKLSNGEFALSALDWSGLEDGLHLLRVRVFAANGSDPGIFQTFVYFFYKDSSQDSEHRIDGDLADMGAPIALQTRTATSNLNRLDALYVDNDDRYLYIGLAGRVSDSENQTNGFSLFIDADNSGTTGVNSPMTLQDDSGPAARLISNSKVSFAAGFGADFAVGVFRNRALPTDQSGNRILSAQTSATMGCESSVFRINASTPTILAPLSSRIDSQIRVNKTDPAKGAEIAIPIESMFGSGIPTGNVIRLVAFHDTTGETGAYLSSTDPLRATLGGRPAATGWVSNQILPSQPFATDPGTLPVTFTNFTSYGLKVASDVTSSVTVTAGPITFDSASGNYRQSVTIANNSASKLGAPLSLRIATAPGIEVINKTGNSVVAPGAATLEVSKKALPTSYSMRVELIFHAPSSSFTPVYTVLAGKGIR